MKNNNPSLVISYLTLRKYIGILGIALPFVVLLGSILFSDCNEVQSSISAYYHTIMRNIFVGIVFAIGLFFFAYNGYDLKDKIASKSAAIFAFGVAFFPTSVEEPLPICNIEPDYFIEISSLIHFICATGFFLILVFFSILLFPKTDKKEPGRPKLLRNSIFYICGYTILSCIVLIGIYKFFLENTFSQLSDYDPIFWLETIALVAFGISWLTKGQLFLKDAEK